MENKPVNLVAGEKQANINTGDSCPHCEIRFCKYSGSEKSRLSAGNMQAISRIVSG